MNYIEIIKEYFDDELAKGKLFSYNYIQQDDAWTYEWIPRPIDGELFYDDWGVAKTEMILRDYKVQLRPYIIKRLLEEK